MRSAFLLAGVTSAAVLNFQLPFTGIDNAVKVEQDAGSATFPHLPQPPLELDLSDLTIAQILNKSLHDGPPRHEHGHFPPGPPHTLPLRRLAWLLNISDAADLKAKLADESAQLTFIAPDDRALTPPGASHGPPHGPPHHDHPPRRGPPHHDGPHHGPPPPPHHGDGRHPPPPPRDGRHPPPPPPGDCHNAPPKYDDEPKENFRQHPLHSHEIIRSLIADEPEDKRKEFFKKIVGFVLKYHLVDGGAYKPHELAEFSTVASSLNDTRIHVGSRLFPKPSLVFNFFSSTVGVVVRAKNGYIYIVNSPLLPPLPPLAELFVVPGVFSTLTSGVQKVGLDLHTFEFPHGHGFEEEEIHPMVSEILEEIKTELPPAKHFTVFAPTNGAFRKLGWEVNGFLFSPFGRRILKDVLSYHVVPDVVFYSDFNINATATFEGAAELPFDHDEPVSEELHQIGLARPPPPPKSWLRSWISPPPPPAREVKLTSYNLKTLFNETSLPVDVYTYRKGPFGKGPLSRSIWVGKGDSDKPGSRVKVVAIDVPAFKGAIQVVDSLIRPPFPEHEHPHHEGGEPRPLRGFLQHWRRATE